MKNNNRVLLTTLLLLAAVAAFAQPDRQFDFGDGQRNERVKAARVAYITQRLGLTTGESSAFWALNNEYEDARQAIEEKYKPAIAPEQMTNEQASEHLEDQLKAEAELLELRKTYQARFSSVLPARKLVLFQRADREFRLELLKKIRDNRRPGGRF
ncbi:MAG: hypothetical protein RIC19_23585 [Phaeodactylibacter sp.]|uniref:hypothetical protein n=1 Tax=Phaeodactylibacter sp. TaxID=1940289 RepID=UPI0032EB6949